MKKLEKATIKRRGRKTSGRSLYVQELDWKVILPTPIAYYLLSRVQEEIPFKNFKTEIALYFLSLISSIPARKKDGEYSQNYIPLDSKSLRKITRAYNRYFDYFMKIEVLQKRNYDTGRNRCNSYRYNWAKVLSLGVVPISSDYFSFPTDSVQLSREQIKKIDRAKQSCPHLVQWFDHGLHIDYERFLEENTNIFSINKFSDEDVQNADYQKARNFYYSAFEFSEQNFRVSRDIKSDNRLHTNLTNLSKRIRNYIYYQNENIIGLDIKNSQPYFLILMIEKIMKEPLKLDLNGGEGDRIGRIGRRIYRGYWSTILHTLSEYASDRAFMEEFEKIKEAVLSGRYYEFLAAVYDDIKPSTDKNGNEFYCGKFYNVNRQVTETIYYKTKRDLMKKVSMQLLYTPLNKPSEYYKKFKEAFPMLCGFMEILKTSTNSKDSYKKFPKLLQHYEAECVLDFVTKRVAEKYPDMPIFTVHDSIATTWFYFDDLRDSVAELLKEFSDGMPPNLESEEWNDRPVYIPAA